MVIDRGEVIAKGTAQELKNRVGETVCELQLTDPEDERKVREVLIDLGEVVGNNTLSLPAPEGVATLAEVIKRVDKVGVVLTDISLRRPSLDDVFFALTGHVTEE